MPDAGGDGRQDPRPLPRRGACARASRGRLALGLPPRLRGRGALRLAGGRRAPEPGVRRRRRRRARRLGSRLPPSRRMDARRFAPGVVRPQLPRPRRPRRPHAPRLLVGAGRLDWRERDDQDARGRAPPGRARRQRAHRGRRDVRGRRDRRRGDVRRARLLPPSRGRLLARLPRARALVRGEGRHRRARHRREDGRVRRPRRAGALDALPPARARAARRRLGMGARGRDRRRVAAARPRPLALAPLDVGLQALRHAPPRRPARRLPARAAHPPLGDGRAVRLPRVRGPVSAAHAGGEAPRRHLVPVQPHALVRDGRRRQGAAEPPLRASGPAAARRRGGKLGGGGA